jgi:hypothetical protein
LRCAGFAIHPVAGIAAGSAGGRASLTVTRLSARQSRTCRAVLSDPGRDRKYLRRPLVPHRGGGDDLDRGIAVPARHQGRQYRHQFRRGDPEDLSRAYCVQGGAFAPRLFLATGLTGTSRARRHGCRHRGQGNGLGLHGGRWRRQLRVAASVTRHGAKTQAGSGRRHGCRHRARAANRLDHVTLTPEAGTIDSEDRTVCPMAGLLVVGGVLSQGRSLACLRACRPCW